MSLNNFLGRVFNKEKQSTPKSKTYLILDDQQKIYTDGMGRDVYYSDIVKSIFHAVCDETSKLKIRCVKEVWNPQNKVEIVDNSITQLFKFQPNPLMITRDFLYKLRWVLLKKGNVYIYPRFKMVGNKKFYTDFLIIDPRSVEFYVDENNDDELYIQMTLQDGEETPLINYEKDIIHLRHTFGDDNYLGGNFGGTFDNKDLSKTVDTMNDVTQMMPAAVKSSLKIRGLLKPKSIADGATLNSQREEFENRIIASQTGIAVTDLSADFVPITVNPTVIDSNILKWLEERIAKSFGVSLAILSGDYTDQQKIAFHQKCIESFKTTIEQALTSKLLTKEELKEGLRVRIYDNFINNLSFETRLKIIESTSALPIFTVDEMRSMLGQEPVGDNRRFNSLNNMDAAMVTDYQMKKVDQKVNGTKSKQQLGGKDET